MNAAFSIQSTCWYCTVLYCTVPLLYGTILYIHYSWHFNFNFTHRHGKYGAIFIIAPLGHFHRRLPKFQNLSNEWNLENRRRGDHWRSIGNLPLGMTRAKEVQHSKRQKDRKRYCWRRQNFCHGRWSSTQHLEGVSYF